MSPRSSAALTDSIVAALAVIAAPAAGAAQASVGGAVVERAAGRGLDLHVLAAGRDRVERVGEHGVGAAVADHGVGRAVARVDQVVLRGALEDVGALAAGDVALAGLHGQPVGAAVAGDRDGLGVDVGRGLDVLDVGADQVVLARGAVVAQPVERVRRRDAPAVGRGVDPVAADQRVAAGVGLEVVVAVAAAAACRRRRSRRSCRRPRRRRCVSLRAPPASASLPSPPLMITGIGVRPKRRVAVVVDGVRP